MIKIFPILSGLFDLIPIITSGGICSTPQVQVEPCAYSISIGVDGMATTSLELVFNNSTSQSVVWIVGSTDDADEACARPESGPLWSSFTPFSGLLPAQTEETVVFDVDIDGRGLAQGNYREYGCILLDDVAPIALPIDLVVSDILFINGFEPSPAG